MSREVRVQEFLTEDKSSGHVHARLFHRGGYYVREECQTDQSGAWTELHSLAEVELSRLCGHEWPATDSAAVLEATAAEDDGREEPDTGTVDEP